MMSWWHCYSMVDVVGAIGSHRRNTSFIALFAGLLVILKYYPHACGYVHDLA